MKQDSDGKYKPRERRTKTPEQALSALMRLASRSEKSSGDALRLMRGWGLEAQDQRKVLDKLIELKFIDDRRFAEAYTREKSRLNGWGAYKIRTMLSAKGIAREVIDKALGQIDNEGSRDKLRVMLERKAKTAKASDRYALKGKLLRYGMSLGYDYEQVMAAVEQVMK